MLNELKESHGRMTWCATACAILSGLLSVSTAATAAINRDAPPSISQDACTNEADFLPASGISDANALRNRHVLCVKDKNVFDVDVKNAEGALIHNAGTVTLEAFWSVYGASTGLDKKQRSLKLRYAYVAKAQPQGSPALVTPTFKVIPTIACVGQNVSEVKCEQTLPMSTFTANSVWQEAKPLSIQWPDSEIQVFDTTIAVKLAFTLDGTTPAEGTGDRWEPRFDSWVLRCDNGLIKVSGSGMNGCVFKNASAIWDFSQDGNAPQNRAHIAYAFANLPEVPGKFRLQEGQRSVAMDDNESNLRPLRRTLSPLIRDSNRAVSYARCAADFGQALTTMCPNGSGCQCDEFPPASSLEGAASVEYEQQKYSVRSINGPDNASAGGLLGAFYLRERVIDSEPYWVHVGDGAGTPPPVVPPAPAPINVTSSFDLKISTFIPLNDQQTVYFSATNNSAQDLIGPFRYYFRDFTPGMELIGLTCVGADGVPYIDIGHAAIARGTTVHFNVIIRVPGGIEATFKKSGIWAGKFTGGQCLVTDPWSPITPPPPSEV
jgi:hypothetical protein